MSKERLLPPLHACPAFVRKGWTGAGLTAGRLRQVDEEARIKFGIPTLVLMENAGRAVCEEAFRIIKKKKINGRVAIFCGTGNNGGDGFVCARHLFNKGTAVTVYSLGRKSKIKGAAGKNLRILEKLGLAPAGIYKIPIEKIKTDIKRCGLIIDAIFGVGLDRDIREPHRSVIKAINQSEKPVVSVDIPSGLDASSGIIRGAAIKADTTVTFEVPKKGMLINKGPAYSGKIKIADIGIPKEILCQ